MPAMAREAKSAVMLLQELIDGYTVQLEYYRHWLALAQKARAHVDDDDLDRFLQLHGEKEDVTRRLREQEERLQAGRNALQEELQLERFTLDELERAQVRVPDADAFGAALHEFAELLARLGAVMRDLERVERETETRLRRRLSSLRSEIKDVHSTRRATRAYIDADPDAKEARFIDHKG